MAIKGFVCYCPELRLYHYHLLDSDQSPENQAVDYKFDDESLEIAIATHLAEGREDMARMMASLTGMARLHAHKFVAFDTTVNSMEPTTPSDHFAALDAAAASEET